MATNSSYLRKKARLNVWVPIPVYELVHRDYEVLKLSPSAIVGIALVEYYQRRGGVTLDVKTTE